MEVLRLHYITQLRSYHVDRTYAVVDNCVAYSCLWHETWQILLMVTFILQTIWWTLSLFRLILFVLVAFWGLLLCQIYLTFIQFILICYTKAFWLRICIIDACFITDILFRIFPSCGRSSCFESLSQISIKSPSSSTPSLPKWGKSCFRLLAPRSLGWLRFYTMKN